MSSSAIQRLAQLEQLLLELLPHCLKKAESCRFYDLRFLSSSVTPPIVKLSFYNLISMSTPDGKSRRINELTVFGVGSIMSIKRLCVLISICSRACLYLCTARNTVLTTLSIGNGIGPDTHAPELLAVSTIFLVFLLRILLSYAFNRILIFSFAIIFPPSRSFNE